MKKTITFVKTSVLAAALMIFSVNTWSQTPNWGLENGLTDWTPYVTALTVTTAGTTLPRTGMQSLIITSPGADNIARNNPTTAPEVILPNLSYLHGIAWVAATVPASSFFGFKQSAGAAALTTGLLPNVYERRTYNSAQNTTGADVIHVAGVKTKASAATTIYVDDLILYADLCTTADVTKPTPATVFIEGSKTASSTSFTWTNGSEEATTGATLPAQTGIQKTIILRAVNSVSSTPVLNDQAMYSVTGGVDGPNMIGDWKVISTTVAADATSYTDNDANLTAETTYKYAVVHRDMAYNYSEALVGSAATDVSTAVNKVSNSFQCIGLENAIQLKGLSFGEELTVYNVTGAKVATQRITNSNLTIPVARGIYIVRVADLVTKVIVK